MHQLYPIHSLECGFTRVGMCLCVSECVCVCALIKRTVAPHVVFHRGTLKVNTFHCDQINSRHKQYQTCGESCGCSDNGFITVACSRQESNC